MRARVSVHRAHSTQKCGGIAAKAAPLRLPTAKERVWESRLRTAKRIVRMLKSSDHDCACMTTLCVFVVAGCLVSVIPAQLRRATPWHSKRPRPNLPQGASHGIHSWTGTPVLSREQEQLRDPSRLRTRRGQFQLFQKCRTYVPSAKGRRFSSSIG